MREIAERLDRLAAREGTTETVVPGVRLHRTSRDIARGPVLYRQGLIIVGQGAKRVYLGATSHLYDPDHYLVLTVPLPAECEATVLADEPLLAVTVDIDMAMLNAVIGLMEYRDDAVRPGAGCPCQGLSVARADRVFKETVARLLRAVDDPLEGRVLGRGIVRELLYRVLRGDNAASLQALAMKNTGLSRIDKALRRIHDHCEQPFSVEELAGLVNMSTSAFHRAFKDVTSLSPIQYVKKIRLNKARNLLVDNGLRASDAAREVGYESVSQFNREFKRYFGASPRRLPETGARDA